MMSPAALALASITVMLWILWSDSLRSRKPSPILYTIRIGLFLVVAGILILNLIRHPASFDGAGRALAIVAALIGVMGAGYFARKLVRRAG
ncbi:MAG TPA: hypothetical protein VJ276_02965 [Thermoanaerobaculia bacterium]|nr:hypothetical protein [Thermoanaerobaculia bacterium]